MQVSQDVATKEPETIVDDDVVALDDVSPQQGEDVHTQQGPLMSGGPSWSPK